MTIDLSTSALPWAIWVGVALCVVIPLALMVASFFLDDTFWALFLLISIFSFALGMFFAILGDSRTPDRICDRAVQEHITQGQCEFDENDYCIYTFVCQDATKKCPQHKHRLDNDNFCIHCNKHIIHDVSKYGGFCSKCDYHECVYVRVYGRRFNGRFYINYTTYQCKFCGKEK